MEDKLLKDMVDYIEDTDSVIGALKDRPVFSLGALEKAAAEMVAGSLIKSDEVDEMVELFRMNPDKALESIGNMAAELARPQADYSLGEPGAVARPASRHSKESDRVLYERLGLN